MELEILTDDCIAPTLLIGCLGYEHRSIQVFRESVTQLNCAYVALDYRSIGLHSYDANAEEARRLSIVLEADRAIFLERVSDLIRKGQERIQIDVTSFDRHMLARVLQTIFTLSSSIGEVVLSYFPRVFTEPSDQLENVVSFGPISSAFIGEASFSRDNLALIVGAGFEYGRIVGAMDMLEPERTYCLYPESKDKRFEAAILRNNLDFSFLDDPTLLQPYILSRPDSLYFELRRLVEFELRERNVLILPLGPKLFAAVSLMVALQLHPAVMVWRHSTVSTQAPGSTQDAIASGDLHRLRFRFV